MASQLQSAALKIMKKRKFSSDATRYMRSRTANPQELQVLSTQVQETCAELSRLHCQLANTFTQYNDLIMPLNAHLLASIFALACCTHKELFALLRVCKLFYRVYCTEMLTCCRFLEPIRYEQFLKMPLVGAYASLSTLPKNTCGLIVSKFQRVHSYLNNFTSIRNLTIDCRKSKTDFESEINMIQLLAQNAAHLRCLSIIGKYSMTLEQAKEIASVIQTKELERLDIKFTTNAACEFFLSKCQKLKHLVLRNDLSISHVKHLQSLDIQCLSTSGLFTQFRNFKRLKHLKITTIPLNQNDSCDIADCIVHMPLLERLEIANIEQSSDVVLITRRLPAGSMKYLKISRCNISLELHGKLLEKHLMKLVNLREFICADFPQVMVNVRMNYYRRSKSSYIDLRIPTFEEVMRESEAGNELLALSNNNKNQASKKQYVNNKNNNNISGLKSEQDEFNNSTTRNTTFSKGLVASSPISSEKRDFFVSPLESNGIAEKDDASDDSDQEYCNDVQLCKQLHEFQTLNKVKEFSMRNITLLDTYEDLDSCIAKFTSLETLVLDECDSNTTMDLCKLFVKHCNQSLRSISVNCECVIPIAQGLLHEHCNITLCGMQFVKPNK